jgi:hypothetical protein
VSGGTLRFNMKNISERLKARSIYLENGCIETSFKKNIWGYSQMKIDGKMASCHRVSYGEFIGPIPDGLCILHKCDNPACINPEHLFAGTQLENIKDMVEKRRSMHGIKNVMSKLTPDIVAEIRKRKRHYRSWALELGMNAEYIARVARGMYWRDIPIETEK